MFHVEVLSDLDVSRFTELLQQCIAKDIGMQMKRFQPSMWKYWECLVSRTQKPGMTLCKNIQYYHKEIPFDKMYPVSGIYEIAFEKEGKYDRVYLGQSKNLHQRVNVDYGRNLKFGDLNTLKQGQIMEYLEKGYNLFIRVLTLKNLINPETGQSRCGQKPAKFILDRMEEHGLLRIVDYPLNTRSNNTARVTKFLQEVQAERQNTKEETVRSPQSDKTPEEPLPLPETEPSSSTSTWTLSEASDYDYTENSDSDQVENSTSDSEDELAPPLSTTSPDKPPEYYIARFAKGVCYHKRRGCSGAFCDVDTSCAFFETLKPCKRCF